MKSNKDSDLLKDAIADARAIREIAIENAKSALEEAFTPKLQSMISATIQQEAEDDSEEEVESTVDPDDEELESVEDILDDEEDDDEEDDDEDELEDELDLDEILDYLREEDDVAHQKDADFTDANEEDADEEEFTALHGDDHAEGDDGHVEVEDDDIKTPLRQSQKSQLEALFAEDTELDEELAAVLRELEEEVDDQEVNQSDLDEFIASLEGDTLYEIDLSLLEEEDDDLETLDDEDELTALAGDDEAEGADAHVEVEPEDIIDREAQRDKDAEDLEDELGEDLTFESLLAELEDEIRSEAKEDELEEANEALRSENEELRAKLESYRQGVEILRNQINEVNLINSKLLYTNHLFKKFELDDKQKVRVIEAFDRTGSKREAKLVYGTLSEAFRMNGSKPINTGDKDSTKKNLAEAIARGMSSKSESSTKPSEEKILNEDVEFKNRMKKLANIKK